MFIIHTATRDPHRLHLTVDALFRIEVVRSDEGLAVSIYSAKTDEALTETYALVGEALTPEAERDAPAQHEATP